MPNFITLPGRSRHQNNVDNFMRQAGQAVPLKPIIPDEKVRALRAKLILEETFETVLALGFHLCADDCGHGSKGNQNLCYTWKEAKLIAHTKGPDIEQVVDGCCDIKVVTTGTLSAFGIADEEPQQRVDLANLAKFEGPKCKVCSRPMDLITTTDGDEVWVCTAPTDGGRSLPAAHLETLPREAGPYRRADGKWIKGPDWKPPVFNDLIQIEEVAPA
jgi:predicted HAD superfamily Cof-like phosphohydrolase